MWQFVLQQYLDMSKTGFGEIGQERRKALPPRIDLAQAHPRVQLVRRVFGQQIMQPVGLRFHQQVRRASPDKSHFSPT